MVLRIWEWARKDLGGLARIGDEFPFDVETPEELLLLMSWNVYDHAVEGRRLVEHFLDACASTLTAAERAWLDAQARAPFSIWEIRDVTPGEGFRAVDLLTGAERRVREASASQALVERDAILARIVVVPEVTAALRGQPPGSEERALLTTLHPRPLPPARAAEVAAGARAALGRSPEARAPLPAPLLRVHGVATKLIALWQEKVEETLAPVDLKLHNMDGDPLRWVTDRYEIAPEARREVALRLLELEGAHSDELAAPARGEPGSMPRGEEEPHGRVMFVRENPAGAALERTVIGAADLDGSALLLETNSLPRADALRRRVEQACGARIRYIGREEKDAEELIQRAGEERERPAQRLDRPDREDEPSAEELEVVRQLKAQHYQRWLDMKLPSLGGRTPREAMKSRSMRGQVDVLLKQMENQEARLPPGERFDIAALRAELGLGS